MLATEPYNFEDEDDGDPDIRHTIEWYENIANPRPPEIEEWEFEPVECLDPDVSGDQVFYIFLSVCAAFAVLILGIVLFILGKVL